MITNANSPKLAETIASAKPGFAGLIYTKVGKTVGGVVYGDDTEHIVFNHAFHYDGDAGLKARDLEALKGITDAEILDEIKAKGLKGWEGRGANAFQVEVTRLHVDAARAKIEASCLKSMTGRNTATTDEVYEPLIVNGKAVRGARVYVCTGKDTCKCRNCTGDDRAPLPGTIYLMGLLESREVIVPAANGKAPAPHSNPVTVARRLFEKKLPSARFVQFRLEPGTPFILAIGGGVVQKAMAA